MHIDGGLHSTEVAGAQQSINLAYKLVSSQGDPEVDARIQSRSKTGTRLATDKHRFSQIRIELVSLTAFNLCKSVFICG